jgi:hypothetical protein
LIVRYFNCQIPTLGDQARHQPLSATLSAASARAQWKINASARRSSILIGMQVALINIPDLELEKLYSEEVRAWYEYRMMPW